MKKLLSLICVIGTFNIASAQEVQPDPLNAIVKINTVSCSPNYFSPWKTKRQSQSSGSGVIINGNLILTNAHNIADATYISVSKKNDGLSFTANIVAVNDECDLALLSVVDNDFYNGITPMEIGQTPRTQTQVIVAGYPVGGLEISITQGIISRIEQIMYSNSLYKWRWKRLLQNFHLRAIQSAKFVAEKS